MAATPMRPSCQLGGDLRSLVGGATIEPERMWRVTSDLLLAFFNAHLNGTPAPLLDGPSPEYPEVQFVAGDE